MKKITEIEMERFTTKEVKNALGQRVREKVPIKVRRKVKTVQGGRRFLHYLVDSFLVGGIYFLLTLLGVEANRNTSVYYIEVNEIQLYIGYVQMFISFGFYFGFEAWLGRTPGKFLTRSHVINEYAEKPKTTDILVRTALRWVPFEAFSCLGERGWHDKWSKTWLVNEEELNYLRSAVSPDELLDDDILDK